MQNAGKQDQTESNLLFTSLKNKVHGYKSRLKHVGTDVFTQSTTRKTSDKDNQTKTDKVNKYPHTGRVRTVDYSFVIKTLVFKKLGTRGERGQTSPHHRHTQRMTRKHQAGWEHNGVAFLTSGPEGPTALHVGDVSLCQQRDSNERVVIWPLHSLRTAHRLA